MTSPHTPSRPFIDCDQSTAGIAVADLSAAIDFYTKKLGFTLGFTWGDPPNFAGVNFGKEPLFLHKGTPTPDPSGATVFFMVGDADSIYHFHRANGVEVVQEIGDREYGMRDYAVRDLYGYMLVFGHNTFTLGEKVKIERVDVPLRLEKRLAALVQDLAKQKRMSVDSMFEEMLLHTNEGVGPHTKTTLAYIQELKKKHGIDYDCHASYRFEEKE